MSGALRSFVLSSGVAGILLFIPPFAHADKTEALQQELADSKAAHSDLLKKSTALSSEMTDLRSTLVKTSNELRSSEENLSETDQRLKELRLKKEAYLQKLYKDQQTMGGLVSAVKKYSRTSTPDMLMQSTPIDAARASLVMKSVMPRLQQRSSYFQSQIDEISKIETVIAQEISVQAEQRNKLNKKKEELASLLQQRWSVYQRTEKDRLKQEKEIEKLTKESRNIDELLDKLKEKDETGEIKSAGTPVPRNMLSPVHGKIHTNFGEKDDLGAESRGITFTTRPSSSVVTPLAGKVKFAGPFQKYRQILIVEHKGGYHSLIAGLARIDTVVGASLAAGEPVGIANSSTSPQVYYELRHKGKPVNPKKSLMAQKKQEKS